MSAIKKIIPGLPSGPIAFNAAQQSIQTLYGAYADYKKVVAVEATKQSAIAAWRDTKLTELTNQREVLERFMTETFKERASVIRGFFDTLDKAVDSGNDALIEKSIDGILSIARQSPLLEAKALMDAMRNPDVKVIDI